MTPSEYGQCDIKLDKDFKIIAITLD